MSDELRACPKEQYENEWQKELSLKTLELEKEQLHSVELLGDVERLMNDRNALQTALDATKASRNWNHDKVLELQAKLDKAKEALDLIHSGGRSGTWSGNTCADIADEALKELEGE